MAFTNISISSNRPQALGYPLNVVDLDGSTFVYEGDTTAWSYRVNDNNPSISIYTNINTRLYTIVSILVNGVSATYATTSDSDYNTKLSILLNTGAPLSDYTLEIRIDRIGSLVSYINPNGTNPSDTYVDDYPGNLALANLPTLAEANDLVFSGWYYDPNYTTQALVGDRVADNITLYAKWDNYKLVFNTDGGTPIEDYFGTEAPDLASVAYTPVKEHYRFVNWYQDSNFEDVCYPLTSIPSIVSYNPLTRTATIFAKWLTYNIAYNSNGGSGFPNTIGVVLPTLPTPTKPYYNFLGWYYDSGFTTQAHSGDALSGNVTLYAKWSLITSMTLNLYRNTAEKERVDKTSFLSVVGTLTGTLRRATSLLNPEIDINRDLIDFNYVYIPIFNRYYYVENVASLVTGMWRVSLRVDVLFSYRSEIAELSAYVDRQENNYNPELVDNEVIANNSSSYEYTKLGRNANFGSDKLAIDSFSFVLGGMK